MRAALGLALVAGGALLVVMALHGRTPFDATSASGGSAPAAGNAGVASGGLFGGGGTGVQNPTAGAQTQHFGGMP